MDLAKKNPKALLVGLETKVNREFGQELVRQRRRRKKRRGGASGDGDGAPCSSFRSPVAESYLSRSDDRHAAAWHAAGDACRRHARGGRRGDGSAARTMHGRPGRLQCPAALATWRGGELDPRVHGSKEGGHGGGAGHAGGPVGAMAARRPTGSGLVWAAACDGTRRSPRQGCRA